MHCARLKKQDTTLDTAEGRDRTAEGRRGGGGAPRRPRAACRGWWWRSPLRPARAPVERHPRLGQLHRPARDGHLPHLFPADLGRHLPAQAGEDHRPGLAEKKLTVQALDEINAQMQRYLLVQLVASIAVGLVTGICFALMGLKHAGVGGRAACSTWCPTSAPSRSPAGAALVASCSSARRKWRWWSAAARC